MFRDTTIVAYEVDPSAFDPDERVNVATLARAYAERDVVQYDGDKIGVVVEVFDEPFKWDKEAPDNITVEDGMVQASDDLPVYVVSRQSGGAGLFRASQIDKIPPENTLGNDIENPLENLGEAVLSDPYFDHDPASIHEIEELTEIEELLGFDEWPDSWRESDKPNRLILLDAWVSMGGTWRGCFKEIKSKRICSAMKDEVYGTTAWRSWD